MTRASAILMCAVAVLAGCTTPGTGVSTSTSSVPDVTSTGDAADQALVAATEDGSLLVLSSALEPRLTIEADSRRAFRQPVWSGNDALVTATVGDAGPGLAAIAAADGSSVWAVDLETMPFYYAPMPASDAATTTVLRNAPDGAGLVAELVVDGTIEPLGTTAPFYTAWSPDGTSLAIHAEGTVLTVRTDGVTEELVSPTGAFQAPSWTTSGLFTLRTSDGRQRLSVWRDGAFVDLVGIDGPVRFVAGGQRVAMQSALVDESGGVAAGFVAQQQLPSIPGGRLVVLDLATGEIDTVSDLLVAFFQWDPSGERLLYAAFEDGASLNLTLRIWEAGASTELASIEAQPTWFRDVVPFFDQFVQSIRLWSPDGSLVAIPAVVDDVPVVRVFSVAQGFVGDIEDGVWASWSP